MALFRCPNCQAPLEIHAAPLILRVPGYQLFARIAHVMICRACAFTSELNPETGELKDAVGLKLTHLVAGTARSVPPCRALVREES